MPLQIEPPPIQTPMVEKNGIMQRNWVTWILLALLARLQAVAYVRTSVPPLPIHFAAIGATALVPAAAAGLYRVSWHTRIAVIDGVASSVTLTINSTEGGNAISQTAAAVTGDTLATVQSGEFTVQADGSSLISYQTAYASNTPNKMGYALSISVEQVN